MKSSIPAKIASPRAKTVIGRKQPGETNMTLDLYAWNTSNGRKISIMLEELGVDYNIHLINIGKDEQFAPDFLKISPNNRIPAIVDSYGPGGAPYSMFESGAILLYLADKFGKFNPTDERERYETLVWPDKRFISLALVCRVELAELVREVEQDGARFEH